MSIGVNSEAKILDYEVIDEYPGKLCITAQLEKNRIILSPVLLNKQDTFSIKALISDYEGMPSIDARINGVKTITQYKEGQGFYKITILILFILTSLAMGNTFFGKYETIFIFEFEISKIVVSYILLLLGYIFFLTGVFKSVRRNRARRRSRFI